MYIGTSFYISNVIWRQDVMGRNLVIYWIINPNTSLSLIMSDSSMKVELEDIGVIRLSTPWPGPFNQIYILFIMALQNRYVLKMGLEVSFNS